MILLNYVPDFVFGYDLGKLCIEHQTDSPWFLTKLLSYIEDHIDTVGLYRASGQSMGINKIINKIEKGKRLLYCDGTI